MVVGAVACVDFTCSRSVGDSRGLGNCDYSYKDKGVIMSWNGDFAESIKNCPQFIHGTKEDVRSLLRVVKAVRALDKLACYLVDNGRMSIRKMADVMDCCIEEITKDL